MKQISHILSPLFASIDFLAGRRVLMGMTLAALLLLGWQISPLFAEATAPAEPHVFLPLIARSGVISPTPPPTTIPTTGPGQDVTSTPTATPTRVAPTTTPTTEAPTATPTATQLPPQSIGSKFFVATEQKTGSANIAVDSKGGVHLALYAEVPVEGTLSNALFYLYCPGPMAQCGDLENGQWQGMSGLYGVREVQLELTSAGHPRILVQADSIVYSGGKDYIYIECNQSCTDGSNWSGDIVVTTDGTASFDVWDLNLPQRYFELDPQGRPRFVYLNRNYLHAEPDLYGGYYAWCDTDCATPSNWQTTAITTFLPGTGQWEPLKHAALAFTSAGRPRVLGELSPLEGESGIYYLECNSACEQRASWQRTRLSDRGQGAELSWDLEVNAQDQPRVVYGSADK